MLSDYYEQQSFKQRFLAKLPQTALLGIVVASALAIPFEVFAYRQDFIYLQKLKKEQDLLDIAWGQLLIEQQTFGATTNIGLRAVESMSMHSPKPTEVFTVSIAPDTKAPTPDTIPITPAASTQPALR